jgi:hypothetical protein
MLTLQRAEAISQRLSSDGEHDTAPNRLVDPATAMACESLVAGAMSHLLSGFFVLKNLHATSTSLDESEITALGLASEDIATVLARLNECSVAVWLLPKVRDGVASRLWKRCSSNHRVDAVDNCRQQSAPGERLQRSSVREPESNLVMHRQIRESNNSVPSDPPLLQLVGSNSTARSEWEQRLAWVILHLVAANTAMEALSISAYPWGAPESFKDACSRLCAALVTLDECLGGADD